MKSIYLIAIVFVASCSVINANDSEEFNVEDTYEKVQESCKNEWNRTVPTECPKIDPLNTTVHLAHETDCEKFYMCQAGEKILRICPFRNNEGDRLHFNKRCQVCDWPGGAKCHQSSKDWEDCSNRENGTLLPHECGICKLFYLCRNGDKIAKECPKDKYFSSRYQDCVNKEDSDCPDDIGECKGDGDRLPHECNCEYYYECQDGNRILRKCPNGLHFNRKEKECQDPKDAECKKGPIDKCPKGKKDGDEWPHECDCRLYYKCVEWRKRLQECKWGKWFDDITKTCRLEKDVDCTNGWTKYKL